MLRLLCAILCLKLVFTEDYLDVTINQGPVRGYKSEDVYTFYSIPYATAPTGQHRFRAPLDPPTWNTTFEATEKYVACPQGGRVYQPPLAMREDCLIANVYVPDTEEKNLPVVVYIHGGAYWHGYGDKSPPKQLVQSKKIIAVNFNYRLGVHGFLCLGTEDAPGNAGMKDQVALLRWVKDNIAYFGGNPEDVTIAGCSAGGTSVDLHVVSKITNGLFKKAIPESGANIALFSVQTDPIANAKMFAKMLDFEDVDDLTKLEEFYKNASYSLLTSIDFMELYDSSPIFSPCVEGDVDEEIFLDDDPLNILLTRDYEKLPMLYGFSDMEGLIRVPYFEKWKEPMNENFSLFLPQTLQFKSEKEREKVAQKIKRFYFGNESISDENIIGFTNYFADILFAHPMLKSAKLQAEAGNDRLYLYQYSFYDKNKVYSYPSLYGAEHCAQSKAVLDDAADAEITEDYRNMKAVMRELWLNFIVTGNPVPEGSSYPEWPPANKKRTPYMSLDREVELKGELLPERARFWDKIYSKYYRKPIPPV